MSRLEVRFLNNLGDSWQDATPGFSVQAYHKRKKIVDIEVGETYSYYDWASLTKIIFTTTALMFLHDEKKFRVNDSVCKWIEWFPEENPARLRELLTHTAGMTWWYPFYKSLSETPDKKASPEEMWLKMRGLVRKQVLADLKKTKKHPSDPRKITGKAVYSDIDFFLLGMALENIFGGTLYEAWEMVGDRLNLMDTDFHRGNRPKHNRKLYAPTEKCTWRGKTLQGEAHDDNTWALKGVASHAGLFGPIEDLSRWGLLLRDAMRGENSKRFPSAKTVQAFTKRAIPREKGDWTLGFMMPTRGSASCGPEFSLQSVGHTGFTGTSLWYDPKKDLLVTLLSNRVHPTRENRNFVSLRPQIHTEIRRAIDGE